MTILSAQRGFTRLAVAFIVASALVLTYDGTMRFAQAHGALGWRGAVIAAMNDLAVLVGILWPERVFQALAALCSGLTIWANVDHAAPGAGGLVIALVPPILAILMVGALEIVVRGKPQIPSEIPAVPTENDEKPEFPLHLVGGKWEKDAVLTWLRENPTATLKEASEKVGWPVSTIGRWRAAA